MDAQEFLRSLAIVLCTAGVATVVLQRLRQPVVLGYVLAGLVIGPHVPVPLVADPHIVRALSELGVILLMFSLGLGFRIGRLVRLAPTAGLTALIECSIMLWLGLLAGRAFGWTARESLFAGAVVAISSTTIIARALEEHKVRGPARDLVVGILVAEDLIAILLLAALTAVAAGAGLTAAQGALLTARLAAFLAGLVAVGLVVVPRAVRAVRRLERPETTVVASIGLCFAAALLAHELGYSVALGAFVAGSLVAESGAGGEIAHHIRPVRDLLGAVFFVSVGMAIDPALVLRHAGEALALTAVVVLGKVACVSLGAFLTGNGLRASVQAGMSLAQIGEFSFLIAGMGLARGATGEFLFPVAVAVSLITTVATPALIRASGPAAAWVDRKLPRRLQTAAALYASWVERLRAAPRGGAVGRLVRRLILEAAVLVAIAIGGSLALDSLAPAAAARLALSPAVAVWLVTAAIGALCLPFVLGLVRLGSRLGNALGELALPVPGEGRPDLAAAPRRVLVLGIELAILLGVGLPVAAVTQPFLRFGPTAGVLGLLALVLGWALWRGAANLEGHVRAGTEAIVELLARQAAAPANAGAALPMVEIEALLPGLGEPETVALVPDSPACGRTLAQLNLRGVTGATVLAIRRADEGVVTATASETLRAGDVLVVTGSHAAISAARSLLAGSGRG